MGTIKIYIILGLCIFTQISIIFSQNIIEYKFNNSFSSTDGNGSDLVPVCSGEFVLENINGCSIGAYHFDINCGLQFNNKTSNNLIQDEYTIEMYFKFEDLYSWKKIIDFKNIKSDNGLYGLDGRVDFWPITTSPSSPFTANVFAHILVTREASSNTFTVYVDGLQYISFIDTGSDALLDSDQILSFFYDDPIVPNEASAGTVALIKLYDYLLEPNEVFDNFSNIINTTVNVEICPGQSYFAQGMPQTNAGSYRDTIVTASGCDSVIITHISFIENINNTIVDTICVGQSLLGYTNSGMFIDTTITPEGCLEITNLNLTVMPVIQTSEVLSICDGDYYKNYNISGIHIDTFNSIYGCDSIHTIDLSVLNNSLSSEDLSICRGENFRGYTYSTVIVDTLSNMNGCDSLHSINLIVNDLEISSLEITNTSCAKFDGSATIYLNNSTGSELFILNDSINSQSPYFNNLSFGNYDLLILNEDCLVDTTFSIIRLNCPIYIPNAISPNGDGVNDVLEIFASEDSDFTVLSYAIYNRWGGLLYSFTNDTPLTWWDGTSNGQPLNTGTYIYSFTLLLEDGSINQYSGDFYLSN